MKKINNALFIALAIITISCKDSETDHDMMGTGEVTATFDNGYKGNDLILGAKNSVNANGEVLTINRFTYIVSNFSLVDKSGNEFIFPKDESYFIVNHEESQEDVALTEIPAGEYTTLKFGVGVDQEKYNQGANGQGDFLTLAQDNNMMWSWQAGYKFLNFEGTFTSSTITNETSFKIHMGSHGSSLDNYKEVLLELPTNLVVADGTKSNVHIEIDASKILTAVNSIKLSEKAVIMVDAVKSPMVAENTSKMFHVHHVHNGSGHH